MTQWSEDLIPLEGARTLDGLFVQRVRRSPDRPAYRSFDRAAGEWRELSWGDMARRGSPLATGPVQRKATDRRPGGRAAAQLSRVGHVRHRRPVPGSGDRSPLHRRPRRQRRLHPAGRGGQGAAGAGRGALEAAHRGGRSIPLSTPRGDPGVGQRHTPVGRRGRARDRRRGLATRDRSSAHPARRRSRRPGHHRLHLRHYRASQGRDAEPPEHSLQRPRLVDHHRLLPGGRLPLLPAAIPHPRAHGELLPADDGGRHRGLRALRRPNWRRTCRRCGPPS